MRMISWASTTAKARLVQTAEEWADHIQGYHENRGSVWLKYHDDRWGDFRVVKNAGLWFVVSDDPAGESFRHDLQGLLNLYHGGETAEYPSDAGAPSGIGTWVLPFWVFLGLGLLTGAILAALLKESAF